MHSDRYKAGWEKLKEIDGEVGEKVVNSLEDISPDLAKFIIEYSFGDIYAREGLDLKTKEIAVVAALTAMGTAQPQLKVHLNGALNTGSTVNEVKEVILQMAVYSGFPSCINAMNAFREVLTERHVREIEDIVGKAASEPASTNRLKRGEDELHFLDSLQLDELRKSLDDLSPDLLKFILEFALGDIHGRDNLSKKHRQAATIAALTALGNASPQLRFHINAGLNIGLTAEEVKEVMLLMTIYAGFPAAINGTNLLKDVLAERAQDSR